MVEHLTAGQKREFKEAFLMCDADGTGEASLDELEVAVKSLGRRVERAQLGALMKQFNKSGGEEMMFNEFMKLMVKLDEEYPQDSAEKIREAFGELPSAKGNTVSLADVKNILQNNGYKFSAAEADELLAQAGVEDAEVDFEEFISELSH
eukprot:TRINITY_DN27450_c0_g1_i1.p3 TRINITY_DN27450_c0_g1~~TRINITY_DN27450_c0_g1_i1.p3  ORF type:complete len:150 (+),score=86.70 TRINITY_DN27450_c0_g1_i1:71-520(+)